MESLSILTSTAGGAILGGILTWVSSARKESHERQIAIIDKMREISKDADDSADKAMVRDTSESGARIRRFIVVALVFSFCIAPFVFAFFPDIPIAVERSENYGGWLWGLIPECTRQVVEYAKGFYIPSEFKGAFMAIIGFYFGRSAAK